MYIYVYRNSRARPKGGRGINKKNGGEGSKKMNREHKRCVYSPPQVDRILGFQFWVYYNKIPICPIFYPLKGDYIYIRVKENQLRIKITFLAEIELSSAASSNFGPKSIGQVEP